MDITLYQVDAFTDHLFGGNPAAVIPLENWIDDTLMQRLALENNLSETVFFVRNGNDFDIRWFTPEVEINLCGHATLASAYVLFNMLGYAAPTITFHSKSGPLVVSREGDVMNMDFPSWKPEKLDEQHELLLQSLGNPKALGLYRYRDWLLELEDEEAVKNCKPDFGLMKTKYDKVIITAQGSGPVDFVSRFFAPGAGIDEDPVTGSAHAQLIPFWSDKLGKKKMFARQLSKRGGDIYCEQNGDRVMMGGRCVFYMKGVVSIDNRQWAMGNR